MAQRTRSRSLSEQRSGQSDEKGPAARRRPRAAREAYSLYVERAAEGANVPRRGASPPFRSLPPGFVAPAKPALERGTLLRRRRSASDGTDRRSHRSPLGVPL